MIKYITTRTPLRVSFVGGGTDFYDYYKYNGGQVISGAIDRYVYVTVKRHSDLYKEKFRLNYSITETASKIENIKNEITRACLKLLKINFPIYISTISDIPISSGLGSSSAFTVGLLTALHALKGDQIKKNKIAEEACKVEINILKKPIGKQDQYAVTFGSINRILFKKDNTVTVKKINLSKQKTKFLSNHMYLVWTGYTRNSSSILKEQKKRTKKNVSHLNQIKNLVTKFSKNLNKKKVNINTLSEILNLNWSLKKTLSSKILNRSMENIYMKLENSKASGIKLLGAGGGGFYLAIVKKKDKSFFLRKMRKYKIYNFKIDELGVKKLYNDE